MERIPRHQLIKRLQTNLPRGAPFDVATLNQLGVSSQLAARYVSSGWLVRLASGVYAFPNDDFNLHATLRFLQQRVPGLHVGGKTALAWQGVRHQVGRREPLVLWGDTRFALPSWFTSRFPARYMYARLFDWPDSPFAIQTLIAPPDVPAGVQVAVPERAVLELLYDVGVREGLDDAHAVFEGLRSPRKKLLGQLLACCTSVKTVRLCLTWARETNLLDVDALLAQFSLPTGSGRRWISQLPDGTLLVLRPHG
ncbi:MULTISPECIES: type IV toxin-antitoxin system AbiEi family antitoxin domain-containing protein [Burkholderiaceae]|uniref:type IV toxin-antitoxin system AbiEi family antitoxin domain-containing protein n=1 Tax=Burkholderiaceae TaxID=119060 RepID=UPI00095B594D|nr:MULTISPECIES: type IV toxin-antitoxin system AbiEi family antitoxin domain-containing protein [Burkholderiaceae]MCG1018830.1 type IV toxin-antitoxin system AbiEi family antitoxin [Mycetohabitans sp. B4]SIT74727.1 Transcriptional regulator, AbiEi antitoxin, Type IV TA system [Burkholderia sp. b13]